MTPQPRSVAILFALLLAGTTLASTVAAESAFAVSSTLPSARDEASALWIGGAGWVFGGRLPSGVTREIVRFVPGTGAVDVPVNLPTARRCTAAVYTGTDAYIIGGSDATGANLRSVVKFTLQTMTVGPDQNILPQGRNCAAAVWTGSEVYIFGGCCDSTGNYHNRILRYVPSTGSVTTLALSGGQYGALAKCCYSAVWDPVLGKAYLFGGEGGTVSGQIVEWTKATNTVAVKSVALPSPRIFASAAWDSDQRVAYLFGGMGASGSGFLDSIVRYVPATNSITTLPSTLPTGRGMTAALWTGAFAYVFGGSTSTGMTNEIVRFNPGNSAPSAQFTSSVSGQTATVDGSASTDPDHDPLTYTWNWGDGSPTSTGVVASHAFSCVGPYSVRLTVSDGAGGSGSRTQSVALDPGYYADGPDGDGMPTCAEAAQGTSDDTPDFDHDGLNDLVESAVYPDRKAVFCPTPTSPDSSCAYPRPTLPDLYVEVDNLTGGTMAAADYQAVIDAFASSPLSPDIRLVVDSGQLGGGQAIAATGDVTPEQAHDYQRDPATFNPDRYGIYHHAVVACHNTLNRYIGWGYAPGDWFVVYACGLTTATKRAVFMHELGHNVLAARLAATAGGVGCEGYVLNPGLPAYFDHVSGQKDCDGDGLPDLFFHSSDATDVMYGGALDAQTTYRAETWGAIKVDWLTLGSCYSCNDFNAGSNAQGGHGDLAAVATERVAPTGPPAIEGAGLLALLAAGVALACVRWARARR